MMEVVYTVLFLIPTLPILVFYVVKYGVAGYLRGHEVFDEWQEKRYQKFLRKRDKK